MFKNERLTYEEIPESLRLDPYEVTILRILFCGEEYNEENARALFEGLNLDTAGTPYLLLLAQLGRQHNWMYFPKLVRSRVSGVQSWYHVKNAGLKPCLMDVVRKLQEENIDVMFLKGMTMQAYYDPGKVRLMHDADFTVRACDLERAKEIVRSNYDAFNDELDDHHVTLKQHRTSLASFELQHSYINYSACDESIVWNRALATMWNGLNVYVPSPEDELVLVCDNDSRDFGNLNYIHMALKCLYDIGILASSYQLDWDYIINSSHRFKNEFALYLILSVASFYLPGLIPKEIFARFNLSEKELEQKTHILLRFGTLQAKRLPYSDKNPLVYYLMGVRVYPYMFKVMKLNGIPSAQRGFMFWLVKKKIPDWLRYIIRQIDGNNSAGSGSGLAGSLIGSRSGGVGDGTSGNGTAVK